MGLQWIFVEWMAEMSLNIQSRFLGMETVVPTDPYFERTIPPRPTPQNNHQPPPTEIPPQISLEIYHIIKDCVLYWLLQKYETKPEPHRYVVFMHQAALPPLETFLTFSVHVYVISSR